MALPPQFLDEIRARVSFSSLAGGAVKLVKAGREFKACCPFHSEKTPSFTINDEKGFGHCFGCGWHGDVFRWLQDHQGLPFIEAVKELASRAGLEMPAPSPEMAARAERVETVRGALDAAQAVYRRQLGEAGAVMEYLAGRGIGPAEIETFALGYARGQDGSLRGTGIGGKLGLAAGLLAERTDGNGLKEVFWDRVTVPMHDARGQLVGFAARVHPTRRTQEPKWLNTPATELFDKGRLLFNQHRASPLARPGAENRLVVCEGQFDVIALARVGIGAAVAPGGTALTEAQLERCWRMHHRPVLLMDGDSAGQKAALRACVTALPLLGPGRELAVAVLPAGRDPDDLVQALGVEAAAREIEAVLLEAVPLHRFVFDGLKRAAGGGPEGTAGIWQQLSELAATVRDDETRAQYLGTWRAMFERECSAVPVVAQEASLHTISRDETGEYAFPDAESDSAGHLIMIVRRVLRLREQRAEITADIADVMKFAESIGFSKKEVGAVVRDVESDLQHGPAKREEAEMLRVLYRRTLGIRGPMNEAMLPQVVDARPKAVTAQVKRQRTIGVLIDAGGL